MVKIKNIVELPPKISVTFVTDNIRIYFGLGSFKIILRIKYIEI